MEQVLEWVKNNLTLVIALTAVAVLLIVLISVSAVTARKKRAAAKRRETASENVKKAENTGDSDKIRSLPEEKEKTVQDNAENAEKITEEEEALQNNVVSTPEPSEDAPVFDENIQTEAEEKNSRNAKTEESDADKKTNTVRQTKSDAKTRKPVHKSFGKWTVQMKATGEYVATLSANNGEIMLASEIYTTEEGARSGIATIINCVSNGKFVIYCDKNKNYYYKLKSAGNRLLCVGEIYKSKDQCLKAVETVKRIAARATISADVTEGAKYVDYKPVTIGEEEVGKGMRGRWRVESTEEGRFCAKLYASNGQLMLATEEVSLRKSAENAIEAVRKNSLAGNFIIDRDKFGRYYYKLRNAQKSVICIGEAYDSLESCINALESVRRFAANTPFNHK